MPEAVQELAGRFTAIAACIEGGESSERLLALLRETQAACEQAANAAPQGELKGWLVNLRAATETWREVWPRLGGQREFRHAVAREARLWSKRLLELELERSG